VPAILALPAVVLVVVALATWRLERRLAGDAGRLAGATERLASLRQAVAALGADVADSGLRHDDLANR
jgi:hypothetical protein